MHTTSCSMGDVCIFVGRSYATDMWLLGIAPAIAVVWARAREPARTWLSNERRGKLCFSAKLRRQRCCLAERCLQRILPACRPIHCPRPGARASKKGTRASAHIKWLFSTKQVVSPVLTSATGAAFLVCARKQRGSAFARLRSHRQRLRPVIHTLCSRGDNQETVQPRNSARYRRKEPERRPASFPRTEKRHVCGRWESHVTDNFTLRTMGGVHTCRLLRNVQTGQHSRLQRSCCPVWALQHIHTVFCAVINPRRACARVTVVNPRRACARGLR